MTRSQTAGLIGAPGSGKTTHAAAWAGHSIDGAYAEPVKRAA